MINIINICPPQAVEDGAIWVQADHAVLDSDPMQEGLFVIKKVGVGEPELVGDSIVECQVERQIAVGKPLVPPALLEVHGYGIVLAEEKRKREMGEIGGEKDRRKEGRKEDRIAGKKDRRGKGKKGRRKEGQKEIHLFQQDLNLDPVEVRPTYHVDFRNLVDARDVDAHPHHHRVP